MGKRIALEGAREAPNYFRLWRKHKKLLQREIADPLNISVALYSKIETGKVAWSKGFLEGFATIVGCPNVSDPITRPPPSVNSEQQVAEIIQAAVEQILRTG